MNKTTDRTIIRVLDPAWVTEGAGVPVKRALPSDELSYEEVDPFLLLDIFDAPIPPGDRPSFPRHPHRGFEIITYLLSGATGHADDIGNKAVIHAGGLQKITTGRGIWHEEGPIPENHEPPRGMQLWINLAKTDKKIPPEYQVLKPEEVPIIRHEDSKVRVLVGGNSPIRLHTPALYLDVTVSPAETFGWDIPTSYQGFVYILNGQGKFGASKTEASKGQFLVIGPGKKLQAIATSADLRFMLAAGQPHREPIRWSGPFVD